MPPRRLTVEPDAFSAVKTSEPTYAAKPNHRKAQDAWPSWQRLTLSTEPDVTMFELTYALRLRQQGKRGEDPKAETGRVTSGVSVGSAYRVKATVHSEVGGQRNAADEEEQGVERIQSQWENGSDDEAFVDGGRDLVKQGQHGEDRHEHHVVDD